MLKKMKMSLLLLLCIAPLTSEVKAASEDECAIWLCAPSGFRQGCDGARRAMDTRVHRGQSPCPAMGECAEDDGSMKTEDGYAAYIPAGQRCSQWDYGGEEGSTECLEYESWGASWVHDTTCVYRTGEQDVWEPYGCAGTARYIAVRQNGLIIGEPYYWNYRDVH